MINDLLVNERRIKFVDDTVTWELCHASGNNSRLQSIADDTAGWSLNNGMQLNADKTKEMVVRFSKKFSAADLPTYWHTWQRTGKNLLRQNIRSLDFL